MCTPLLAWSHAFWGEAGHRLTAQAASAALPDSMPAFFRGAAKQLAYLNPDPDRWRSRAERDPALSVASGAEHFINTEMIPADRRANAFAAPTRYAYADTLRALGLNAEVVGFLPFRILELTQRLRVEFALWRTAPNDQTREWIEARIINDAGILGHYVADGSNPAHTSANFNGWVGPNPNGYATDKQCHSRFESAYVQAKIILADVQPLVEGTPRIHRELRPAVLAYLNETFGEVEHLYQLDKAAPFSATTESASDKQFAAARLAAGARMLRDLWWTAWITSADSTRR
ncbi:MAG: nuclease [Gemmatimonadota bacterium]|nr:nuclease [Gemmatimonadota bacterium]